MRKEIIEHKFRKRVESLINQGFDPDLAESIAESEKAQANTSIREVKATTPSQGGSDGTRTHGT
jgi:hypothetical protein